MDGGGGQKETGLERVLHGNTRSLRTAPTFVTADTFCASQDTRVSYGWCLLIQEYLKEV